ncbi:hypothetical protein GW866_00315 [bacterium]|nr:hypothetical protein [bacterium]
MDKSLQRRTVVDPAVADMLSDMERRKRIANLPKSKQSKARKDAVRHKVGLDLPPALHDSLRQIAEGEHISISSLAAFFAQRGIEDYEEGKFDLSPHKRLSRCARFEYVLDLAKLEKS